MTGESKTLSTSFQRGHGESSQCLQAHDSTGLLDGKTKSHLLEMPAIPSPVSFTLSKVLLSVRVSECVLGAFGSGATFAMEDGWILARALEYTQSVSLPVGDALEIFNTIRSPYYARMYEHLDESEVRLRKAREETNSFDDFLRAKIKYFLYGDKDFIYKNDIQKVWEDYLEAVERHEE